MRRILSFLLVFAMAFSILPAQAFGQEAEPDTRVETGDVTIQGTNGFGNLLSNVISEEQAEAASDYDGGYTVTDLKIQGNVATVTYAAMEEAILIVAVYTEDGLQLVEAEVPMSEVADYAITLRSMTQGRGSFSVKFERYEEVPRDVQDKIIAEYKVEVDED